MTMTYLGIGGVILGIILTHLAMLTFYKKYQYWWNYYSDLGYLKNRPLSRWLNGIGFTAFGFATGLLWYLLAQDVPGWGWLIWMTGWLGSAGLIGVVAIPYDKYLKGRSLVHGACVLVGNIMVNLAIILANAYIGSVWVWLHVGWFLVYFSIWAYTGRIYKHDLKEARPLHAPVQRLYVWTLELAAIVLFLAR